MTVCDLATLVGFFVVVSIMNGCEFKLIRHAWTCTLFISQTLQSLQTNTIDHQRVDVRHNIPDIANTVLLCSILWMLAVLHGPGIAVCDLAAMLSQRVLDLGVSLFWQLLRELRRKRYESIVHVRRPNLSSLVTIFIAMLLAQNNTLMSTRRRALAHEHAYME